MINQNPKNSIKGWYFTNDEIRETIQKHRMLNSSIDLTNACNLNCPYCYIEEKNSTRKVRRSDELSLEENLKVIDELKECGTKTINIVGAGEPTIDPHFKDVIQHIYKNEMSTVLFTNGIKFYHNPEILEFLYKRDVSIVLKYNSVSRDIQDLVAGTKGYGRKRDKVLDYIFDYGFTAHKPTRLGIDIIIFNGNVQEISQIHSYCRENNIFPIAGEYIPTGRTEDGEFKGQKSLVKFSDEQKKKIVNLLQPIDSPERTQLLDELYSIDESYGISRENKFAYYGGGICTQILGVYVDIQGNIWPCVARKKRINGNLKNGLMGNIRNGDSIKDIWKSEKYIQKIMKEFDGGCPYKANLT